MEGGCGRGPVPVCGPLMSYEATLRTSLEAAGYVSLSVSEAVRSLRRQAPGWTSATWPRSILRRGFSRSLWLLADAPAPVSRGLAGRSPWCVGSCRTRGCWS